MSVPSNINSLSTTAGQNSPPGEEPVGNNASLYLQTIFAFIAQLRDGIGLAIKQALNMNSFQINGLAAGTTNTDAVNLQQLKTLLPVGNIQMWAGSPTNIAATWGPNWALCDGTNGTVDMRGRFVVGAGGTYAPGATGGSNTVTLTVANLPPHNHPTSEQPHGHPTYENPHGHPVNQTPHDHSQPHQGSAQAGSDNGGVAVPVPNGYGTGTNESNVNPNYANISIGTATTGLTVGVATTGLTVGNTGSGTAINITPPYYAVCFVQKIASN